VLTADVLRRLKVPTEQFNASFEAMMRAGMDRLMALQRPSGGWGWFDNDGEDPFMTACAVHGLSECQRLGFPVDAVALKRGRERLRAMAAEEKDPNRRAYAAYVLGAEFEPLLAEADALSPYAQALLVLALRKAGRPEAAGVAAKLAARVEGDHWTTPRWYYKWDDVTIETTAYAVQALLATDPQSPLIPKAAGWLLSQRQGNRWRSTKDTAVAIATLLQVAGLEQVAGAVAVEGKGDARPALPKRVGVALGGRSQQEVLVDLNNPLRSRFEAHFADAQPGQNVLVFEKLDDLSEFAFGVEVTMRVLDPRVTAESRGVSVSVEYDRPIDALRLGDEVTVTVTASAAAEGDYVMILSPIPAGCEVIRGSGTGEFARFEERYEKAIFFLRKLGGPAARLRYKMRCSFAGRFGVLPAWAGLMYNEEIYGTGAPAAAVISP
jgi:hypothetical protein